jgi:hypothetical protein
MEARPLSPSPVHSYQRLSSLAPLHTNRVTHFPLRRNQLPSLTEFTGIERCKKLTSFCINVRPLTLVYHSSAVATVPNPMRNSPITLDRRVMAQVLKPIINCEIII